MNVEHITPKHVNELEQLVRQLLVGMRKAKFHDDVLVEALRQLEAELGKARRAQFDTNNREYQGF